MTGKTRGIYWLTIEPLDDHSEKAAALAGVGFEVTFFQTLDALVKELKANRVATIVVGDEGPEVVILKAISLLNSMPEIQGAKLILSCSRYSPTVTRLAACDAFRDILPIDLEPNQWLARFLFASGLKTDLEAPKDVALIETKSEAHCAIPARVVWISDREIWLESRVFPEPGTEFSLTGPMAQFLGKKSLAVQVVRTEKKNLTYRFSMALICRMTSESGMGPADVHAVVKDVGIKKPIKVFLVVQSPALRGSLIRHLEGGHFEVRAALQKKSLTDEPKYFCPKLVIIEEKLTYSGEHSDRFSQMASHIPHDATILVIGEEDSLSKLATLSHGRVLKTIKRLPKDFQDYLIKNILPPGALEQSDDEESRSHIPKDHELSLAELRFPATISGLSGHKISISLPHPVGKFGLIRVESPILEKAIGRFPYAKITKDLVSHVDAEFPFHMECFLSDVPQAIRNKVQKSLDFADDVPSAPGMTQDKLEDTLLRASVRAQKKQGKNSPEDPSLPHRVGPSPWQLVLYGFLLLVVISGLAMVTSLF